jgi:hypothetical protein
MAAHRFGHSAIFSFSVKALTPNLLSFQIKQEPTSNIPYSQQKLTQSPTFYQATMSRKNFFTCETVYNRLQSEKEKHNGEGRWWADCLEWQISNPKIFKKEKITVTYIQCTFTDANGDFGRPIIDCHDEINQGSISPVTEEEAEQLNLEMTNKNVKIEARKQGKPYVRVKKYTMRPKTKDNDGVTIEELPGPEHESLLYKTIELYNEAFVGEFKNFLNTGIIALAGEKRKKGGPKPLVVQDIKIRQMIHDTISETDPENPLAGEPLANPSARLQLKHDFIRDCFDDPNDTKTALLARKTRILDYDTQDLAMFEGAPVKNSNVHKYLRFGAKFNARIDFGSVCCSSSGISNPAAVLAIAVKQPEIKNSTFDTFGSLFVKRAAEPPTTTATSSEPVDASDTEQQIEPEPQTAAATNEEAQQLLEALAG